MRVPTMPNFGQIWQSIAGAFHDPEEQRRRALEEAEQLRRAALYESLVEHPGWMIYLQEMGERIEMAEQAILIRLPLPAESAPSPDWLTMQETAIRGQLQGYRIAMSHVADAIAAAREMVERSKAKHDDGAPSHVAPEGDA